MPAAAAVMSRWRAWAGGTNFPLHLAVCLGLGEAVHQRLDLGEPERLGGAELEANAYDCPPASPWLANFTSVGSTMYLRGFTGAPLTWTS